MPLDRIMESLPWEAAGFGNGVSSTNALQDVASVDDFLDTAATEQNRCLIILRSSFCWSTTCSPPVGGGEHECISHQISFVAFCTATTRMSTVRAQLHENFRTALAGYCGLDKPPSIDRIDRFLTDLEHIVGDVFGRLVKRAAVRGLLDSTDSIDSTHVEAIQYNDAASWNYDPTAEEYYYYYYGFGCTIVSTGSKIPIAAEFTQSKQASQETAMRVTRDTS